MHTLPTNIETAKIWFVMKCFTLILLCQHCKARIEREGSGGLT